MQKCLIACSYRFLVQTLDENVYRGVQLVIDLASPFLHRQNRRCKETCCQYVIEADLSENCMKAGTFKTLIRTDRQEYSWQSQAVPAYHMNPQIGEST